MKTILPTELRKNSTTVTQQRPKVTEAAQLPSEVLSSIPIVADFKKEETISSVTPKMKRDNLAAAINTKIETGWVRQEFPSLSKVYKVKDIQVKPMSIAVVKQLAGARVSKSFTAMVDALSSCINMDIRDLTVPDFYFFMYWLRINSYPKSPLTIKWDTKYGNSRNFVIRNSTLDIMELEISDEDWEKYSDKLTIPTVRDMEILLNSEIEEAEKWEIQYSQYIKLDDDTTEDYMQRKIALLNEYGPEILPEIDEFSNKIQHGVREIIEIKDENVDVLKSIEHLSEEVDTLTLYLSRLINDTKPESHAASLALSAHLEMKAKLLEELQKFKADNYNEETGEWARTYIAEKEKVNIGTTDISLLFP